MHVRLQTWFPFQIQIYVNGCEWLTKQQDSQGIGYQRYDNSIIQVDDVKRAQEIAEQFVTINFAKIFGAISWQINPMVSRIKKVFSKGCYWVLDQGEYATDVMFKDRQGLEEIYPELIEHALVNFNASDVMAFLGRKLRGHFQTKVKLPTGEQKVLARMWQDPFQAVENDPGYSKDLETHTSKLKIDWYLDDNHLGHTETQSETFKDTKDSKDFNPELDIKVKSILILPVMIKAGIYEEDVEERLRSRYAVLSALHVAGYKPNDAEHIGIFEKDIQGVKRDIPYEWFLQETPKKITGYDAVLVLWLGEEYFSGKLLEELNNLFEYIREGIDKKNDPKSVGKTYSQIVLGPTDSTALEEILHKVFPDKDDTDTDSRNGAEFDMYSPSATTEPELIIKQKHLHLSDIYFKKWKIHWQSTVHTDQQLTDALVDELKNRRGIVESDLIVLISEWDTGYGRALPRSFINSLGSDKKVYTFTYMRGIDGMLPGTNDASNSSIKKSTNAMQKNENHSDTGYFNPTFE